MIYLKYVNLILPAIKGFPFFCTKLIISTTTQTATSTSIFGERILKLFLIILGMSQHVRRRVGKNKLKKIIFFLIYVSDYPKFTAAGTAAVS